MFAVSGSQADRADRNKVTLLKLSELQKTQTAAGKIFAETIFLLTFMGITENFVRISTSEINLL